MNKQQLATKIWSAVNTMRSKIDASEYKDYILGFIFYKFLSEKEEQFLYSQDLAKEELKEVKEGTDYVGFVQDHLGYFIDYDNLYSTWLKKGKDFDVSNVTDALSAFDRLISKSYKNLFEGIFDTLQTGLSKLGDASGARTKAINGILQLIRDIPMDREQDYDVLGYIYEFLISRFAASAGKKAGEFYTPHEVSVLISEIVAYHLKDRDEIRIYDPTSGSGSLLITIGKAVAKNMGNKDAIHYYAQELKEGTYNITRMNLAMMGINPSDITTRCGDTLADDWPYFEEGHPETYRVLRVDAVVSNPPYSQRWNPPTLPDNRFDEFGLAPSSKADYAFLLHDLYHIDTDGIVCIVLPHGVLFRGGSEGEIRKNLIEKDNIDTIIGLPANIFYGTGIPTIIMVLKKKRENDDVLIIDASKGFVKEGTSNKLRARDIKKIVDAYKNRKDEKGYCRVVSKEEIRNNDYNLNIPRYVDSSEPTEQWDIYAMMYGGVPTTEVNNLDNYWKALPGLKEELFQKASDTTYKFKVDNIENAVKTSSAIKAYLDSYHENFRDFPSYLYEELVDECTTIHIPTEENILANEVSERLKGIPLVDPYEAYQVIDDNWNDISNDLEVIQTEGFEATKKVDPNMVIKKKRGRDIEVQDGYIGHLLPFSLVQSELMKDDLEKIESWNNEIDDIDSKLSSLIDEMDDEDKEDAGDALNDSKDSFASDAKIKKAVKTLDDSPELQKTLQTAVKLLEKQKGLKRSIKNRTSSLDKKTKSKIEHLSNDEVMDLLNAKWCAPLVDSLSAIPQESIDALIQQLQKLNKKYATTLSDIEEQINETEASLRFSLSELVGSKSDMEGLQEFISLLGGGQNE